MYRLGNLEAEEGNTQRAKEIFEKAIKTEPSEENDKLYIDLSKKELEKMKSNPSSDKKP